jgi:hypothetical protein
MITDAELNIAKLIKKELDCHLKTTESMNKTSLMWVTDPSYRTPLDIEKAKAVSMIAISMAVFTCVSIVSAVLGFAIAKEEENS